MLRIDATNAIPIWRQIEEGIRRLIAMGSLVPGGPVPSVRDLATELRVNPATVSRAYQRLTDAGVLAVRRGEGTFVSTETPSLRKRERRNTLREGALRYASLTITTGSELAEAIAELESAYSEMKGNSNGGSDE